MGNEERSRGLWGGGGRGNHLPLLTPRWLRPTLEAYLCHYLPGGPEPVLSSLSHRGSVGGGGGQQDWLTLHREHALSWT